MMKSVGHLHLAKLWVLLSPKFQACTQFPSTSPLPARLTVYCATILHHSYVCSEDHYKAQVSLPANIYLVILPSAVGIHWKHAAFRSKTVKKIPCHFKKQLKILNEDLCKKRFCLFTVIIIISCQNNKCSTFQ